MHSALPWEPKAAVRSHALPVWTSEGVVDGTSFVLPREEPREVRGWSPYDFNGGFVLLVIFLTGFFQDHV